MKVEELKETMSECRNTIQEMYPFCTCDDIVCTKKLLEKGNIYNVKLLWNLNLPKDFTRCYSDTDIAPCVEFDFDLESLEDKTIATEIARVFAALDQMLGHISIKLEQYKRPRVGLV